MDMVDIRMDGEYNGCPNGRPCLYCFLIPAGAPLAACGLTFQPGHPISWITRVETGRG